jgi:hypothetical protein
MSMKYAKANYPVEIELARSPEDVFNFVIELSKWWPEEFIGEKIGPGTEFELRTGDEHYSTNRVIEFVPNKKVTWLTTGSKRKSDDFDWTGTKFIFELIPKNGNTRLTFTYDGIVPEDEQERLTQICDHCIKDRLYNFMQSATAMIEVARPADEVFKVITTGVSKWWGGKDLSGSSIEPGDEFIVDHPGAHYSKQKLIEVIPGKRVVWLVTESKLDWLEKDKSEWTDTKMIFEISAGPYSTVLRFTHYGLVPEKECYDRCRQGWDMVIRDWLYRYITYGKVAEQLF